MILLKTMTGTFQSTPPARGATAARHYNALSRVISIHAPREGGDYMGVFEYEGLYDISIHAPREGGDNGIRIYGCKLIISIHAPREGGDCEKRLSQRFH